MYCSISALSCFLYQRPVPCDFVNPRKVLLTALPCLFYRLSFFLSYKCSLASSAPSQSRVLRDPKHSGGSGSCLIWDRGAVYFVQHSAPTVVHVCKGAITSKIKHAIKLKTSPARLAQLLQPSLAFCYSLQPMTAHWTVHRHWVQAKTKCQWGLQQLCIMCKSCRTCLKFYCMFYFTCDRSLKCCVSESLASGTRDKLCLRTRTTCSYQ